MQVTDRITLGMYMCYLLKKIHCPHDLKIITSIHEQKDMSAWAFGVRPGPPDLGMVADG
jgi:hypothetical protein